MIFQWLHHWLISNALSGQIDQPFYDWGESNGIGNRFSWLLKAASRQRLAYMPSGVRLWSLKINVQTLRVGSAPEISLW
jgi:hypothetical protein